MVQIQNPPDYCWCSHTKFLEYSDDYSICANCGTLVNNNQKGQNELLVKDDESDLYGREYWLSHMQDYNYPDIQERVWTDLYGRGAYWIKTILKYKSPPGSIIDIGTGPGALVFLSQALGFNSIGLELSPWVVEFTRKTLNINVFLGKIEDQDIQKNSQDIIAMFDVVEHLPNPFQTLQVCFDLLKDDGILVIQTPEFNSEKSYQELLDSKAPFIDHLIKASEHLFLFSKESIKLLLSNVGFSHIVFENPFISLEDYDQFLIASKQDLEDKLETNMETILTNESGILVSSLMDLRTSFDDLNKDRLERIENIKKINMHMQAQTVRIRDLEARCRDLAEMSLLQLIINKWKNKK